MSRKGNKLIPIAQSVNVVINPNNVVIKSKSGELNVDYPNDCIKVENIDNNIKVSRLNDEKKARIFHGTINSNINNAIIGLSKGYEKKLKIVGVGYKANISGDKLNLAIGFSHPVIMSIPKQLKVVCPSPTEIIISGFNKIIVGEFAANVRAIRKPEPYNGKGIMYSDERIIRKVGKTSEGSSSGGGAAAGGAKAKK
jgi:large subunit ribosomal protein L6